MQALTYDDYKQLNVKSGVNQRNYQTNSSKGGTTRSNQKVIKKSKRGDSKDTWIGDQNEDSSDEIYYDNSPVK